MCFHLVVQNVMLLMDIADHQDSDLELLRLQTFKLDIFACCLSDLRRKSSNEPSRWIRCSRLFRVWSSVCFSSIWPGLFWIVTLMMIKDKADCFCLHHGPSPDAHHIEEGTVREV